MADPDGKILHEVLECTEWSSSSGEQVSVKKAGVETASTGGGAKWVSRILSPVTWILSYIAWALSEYVGRFAVPDVLLVSKDLESSWKLAAIRPVGDFGQTDLPVVVALLGEDRLDIRRSTDDFAKCSETFLVRRDPLHQYQMMKISFDGRMIAVTGSEGTLKLFNCETAEKTETAISKPWTIASRLFRSRIPSVLLWMNPVTHDDKYGLLLGDHKGTLHLFGVSLEGALVQRSTIKTITKLPGLTKSLSAAAYFRKRHCLVFGSTLNGVVDYDLDGAWRAGLTVWRIVDEYPFIQPYSDVQNTDAARARSLYKKYTKAQDGVVKIALSPSEDTMVTLFASGAVATWSFPSLRLVRLWMRNDLPKESTFPFKPKVDLPPQILQSGAVAHFPVDIHWWSDTSVVLTMAGGAVYILDVTERELHSITHTGYEQFSPGCMVSPNLASKASEPEMFLVLEENSSGKPWDRDRSLDISGTAMDDSGASEEAEQVRSFIKQMSRNLGFEEPDLSSDPKKQPSVLHRLSLFQKASPKDMFTRKLANREYGEALLIAQQFGLDTDLVHKTRWKGEAISRDTISHFLCRIRDSAFVLQQCLDKLPSDPDVVKELIELGLRQTDLPKIVGLNRGCYPVVSDGSDTGTTRSKKALRSPEEAVPASVDYVAQNVDPARLSEEQIAMIGHRRQLLRYLDILLVYEEMLGGGEKALRYFLAEDYAAFRSKTVLELALHCAHEGRVDQLNTLRLIQAESLTPCWLDVLSNLPETLSPESYQFLIPSVLDGAASPADVKNRTADWCELAPFTSVSDHKSIELETRTSALLDTFEYNDPLVPEQLSAWFRKRTVEIEFRTGLTENCRQLVQIASAKGITDMEVSKDDFDTLYSLVYSAGQEEMTYEKLLRLSDETVLQMLDSIKNKDAFPLLLRQDILPFLKRCERRSKGRRSQLLRALMLASASDPEQSLQKCLKIFQQSLPNMPDPIIPSAVECIQLAQDCILACARTDQLEEIKAVIEGLPTRSDMHGDGDVEDNLYQEISSLKNLVGCVEFANQFGIPLSVRSARDIRLEEGKTIEFLAVLLNRITAKTHAETEWKRIFQQYKNVCSTVFPAVDKYTLTELFVRALVLSGKSPTLELPTKFLTVPDRPLHAPRKSAMAEPWIVHDPLPSKKSTELLLDVGKELFNQAQKCDASDPKLILAASCFELIAPVSTEAVQEIQLIRGVMQLVSEYGVKVDPLDLRTAADRFRFVKEALEVEKFRLQRYPDLLKLGTNLGVRDPNRINEAIARKALKLNKPNICYKLCEELIQQKYQSAWALCLELAESMEFAEQSSSRELQEKLVLFALTNCPEEELEHTAGVKNKVELRRLQTQTATAEPQLDVNDLNPVAKLNIDPCMVCPEDAVKTSAFDEMHDGLDGLRINMDALTQRTLRIFAGDMASDDSDSLLLQMAVQSFPFDASLSLELLGSSRQKSVGRKFFDLVPETPVVVDLAAYYSALEITLQSSKGKVRKILQQNVDMVIQNVVSGTNLEKVDKDLLDFFRLHESRRIAPQRRPNSTPSRDGRPTQSGVGPKLTTPPIKLKGVDGKRFLANPEYRKSFILRTAATKDRIVLLTALQTAEDFGVPAWEVAAAFVEFLFASSSFSVPQIEKLLHDNHDVVDQVKENKQDFLKHSGLHIQPRMSNADVEVLAFYSDFLDKVKKPR